LKILKLRFKNIHSLKGEHLIDFTVSPLKDAGLFAITGPTGAGKSTILDIITLALFNKIPRFAVKGTESISRNDIEKIGSVLTHFTDDAYAEIEYECHHQAYRSKWSISRARTGNLRDYDMELATLSDQKVLDLKKSEVPAENEKLLGLKYEQFIRSILLSQGDFARFLKSDDKDRAKLLEDITDSHIYREIGKRTFETAKIKEDELKSWRMKSEMIKMLDDDIIQNMKNDIQVNQARLNIILTDIAQLTNTLQRIEQKNRLYSKLAQYEKDTTLLTQRKTAFVYQELRLLKHQQLDPYRGRLTIWQNDGKSLKKKEEDIKNLKNQEEAAKERLKVSIEKMKAFTKADVTETNFMAQMKVFENKVTALDGQLKMIENDGKKEREKLNQWLQKNDDFASEFKDIVSIDEQYHTAIKRMNTLADIPVQFDGNNQALALLLENLQGEIVALTGTYKDIKTKEALLSENENLQQQIINHEQNLITLGTKIQSHEDQLTVLKVKIEDAQKQKQHWLKIATLDDHRKALHSGEPCPLCGATDHPYADNIPVNIGVNELVLQQLSEEWSLLEKQIQKDKTQLTIYQANILNYKNRLNENIEKVSLLALQGIDPSATSEIIENKIKDTKERITLYTKEIHNRRESAFLVELSETLKNLIDITIQYKTIKTNRQALYDGKDISGEANQIQNDFVAAKEASMSLNIAIRIAEKELEALKQKWTKWTTDLMDGLQTLNYNSPEEAITNILSDDEFQEITKQKEALVKTETELNANKEEVHKDLKLHEDIEVDQHLHEQKRLALETLQESKKQLHEANGALENELKQQTLQKEEYQKIKEVIMAKEKEFTPLFHLNTLIGDATGNKYAKFAQNISLKNLIYIANRRLEKLSDRYLLAETDIEDDLKVIDIYQGRAHRSVKTLSGGETFIVSLAMALSLADMASQNVRLDSLFIDEGFGTLDQDTMEIALITLEKLQSEGNRTIGIISHVESLKERITTQIKVHKNNLGYSTISVV
jgi:DNA repair protein SbcC/Rad50